MEKFYETTSSSPSERRFWRLKSRVLSLDRPPIWMGILNVTPDSFSDGGELAQQKKDDGRDSVKTDPLKTRYGSDSADGSFHVDVAAACARGLALAADGAEILDIGGESTRPGSRPVEAAEQIARTVPVIESLSRLTDVPISIDTTSAKVADAAFRAGAEIVNDISGATFDPAMIDVVVRWGGGICLGHIRGIPESMQEAPDYGDVVTETADFLRNRRNALTAAGLDASKIVLDPGIGFGKTTPHNLAILSHLEVFRNLGSPILIGHSRKRFLADMALSGRLGQLERGGTESAKRDQRDEWTAAVSCQLARLGVDLLRVHNVRLNRNAVAAAIPPSKEEK